MPIRPPALDDRRYDDLVAELVARIPAHTPEWTNPRAGDPGRTLIELFAWLGDALLYRVNLIPERQRLAFLRLLGQPLRPARPARGLVTVGLKENEPPLAYAIRPAARFAGPVPFEAREEFTVLPVTAAVFYKRPARTGEVPEEVLQGLAEFHRQTGAISGRGVKGYVSTLLFADNKPATAGFDLAAGTADRCLWLALLAPRTAQPSEQPAATAAVRTALGQPGDAHGRPLLNVGCVPALAVEDPLAPVTAAGGVRVPHVWEITANTTGRAVDETHPWTPEYLALDEVADATAGLTRPGVVRLALPRSAILFAPENDVRTDPNAGVADRPPRLDDAGLAARLVAWVRLRLTSPSTPAAAPARETGFNHPGGGNPGLASSGAADPSGNEVEHFRLLWVGVNAVAIEQLVTGSNLIVGESNGAADQEFSLPAVGIEPETLRLEVEEDGGWVAWQRVEDLATLDQDAAASRDAPAFELDAADGLVRFGDGVRGRIPPAGRRVRAGALRSGGGAAGNLPADTLKAVTATTLTGEAVGSRLVVTQPLALTGGAEAETLAEAEKRLPARLRHRERAVTADDYRTLARETPGVAVGRVELLPRFKPQQRQDDLPGIVTVMTLPDRPLAPAPNPRADRPLLEAVHAWLDGRRPLGTELYVIGCEYLPVAVSVAVTVTDDGSPPATTLQAVRDALVRVLWPLSGGGFDGQGWPLGRGLSNRELAVEVARVRGVSEVTGLNVFTRQPPSPVWRPLGDARDGREQNLSLARWQLPELLGVVAVTDDLGAPLTLDAAAANPFADPDAAAVPVVPDLC